MLVAGDGLQVFRQPRREGGTLIQIVVAAAFESRFDRLRGLLADVREYVSIPQGRSHRFDGFVPARIVESRRRALLRMRGWANRESRQHKSYDRKNRRCAPHQILLRNTVARHMSTGP
jgi:DNA-binding response OmpR family regulator